VVALAKRRAWRDNQWALPLVPREQIDDVRDRTNIVEVVKRYVELKRAGTGSWKGLCPFHAEKTASFHVHEARQFFHCFGCGEKGDVFAFLAKIEQRSFSEVLKDLADSAGVALPERQPLTPAERRARQDAESERDRMLRIMDLAASFFEQNLAAAGGDAARAYLDGRGIGAAVRTRFRLGYAPPRGTSLQELLGVKHVSPSDAERLGLTGVGERGRYDFFRDRVMLPVFDRQKRVIGFGSRLLDPEAKDRKYVNSPDSPLFHKKECLYGLHAALDAIRKSGTAIVVEGNFDVLALHEGGFEEAVAPMGTALTAEQMTLLARIARRVVVVFDGDGAGQRAAQKAVPMFVDADVDARIARLPTGQDPDDYVRQPGGPAAFRKLLETARPMLDQFIQDAALDTTVPGRVATLESVAGLLIRVRNPTTRELYQRQLAAVLGVSAPQVVRAMREAQERKPERQQERQPERRPEPRTERAAEGGPHSGSSPPSGAGSAPAWRSDSPPGPGPVFPGDGGGRARGEVAPAEGAGSATAAVPERSLPRDELEVLVLMISYPELLGTPEAGRANQLLIDGTVRQLCRQLGERAGRGEHVDVPALIELAPPEARRSVAAALMNEGMSTAANPPSKLRALVARLELQRLEAEISMTWQLLAQARNRGDDSGATAIMKRGIELDQTKQGLKAALQRP
jgi:DNA primase